MMPINVGFQPTFPVACPKNHSGAIIFDKPADPKILGSYYKITTQEVERFAKENRMPLPPLATQIEGTSIENQTRRLGIDDIWWFVQNACNNNAPHYSFEEAITANPTTQPILGIALLGSKELNNQQLLSVEKRILDRLTQEFSGITGQVMTILDGLTHLNPKK